MTWPSIGQRTIQNAKHRKEAQAVRTYRDDLKEEAKLKESLAVATFDLEEVLPLPKTDEGDIVGN